MHRRNRTLTELALLIALSMLASGCFWLEQISQAAQGVASANATEDVSGDGRYVVFTSDEPEVAADTNGGFDLYRRDTLNDTVELVSVATSGNGGNATSSDAEVSDDGRYVVFNSSATDLVASDTNGFTDIFVRDMNLGTTILISESSGGVQGNSTSNSPAISADGSTVAFQSSAGNLVPGDTNNFIDIFVRKSTGGAVSLISRSAAGTLGNGTSRNPSLNGTGTAVAFQSTAGNLVTGDTNGRQDVFVKSSTGAIEMASVSTAGGLGNDHSGNPSLDHAGTTVAFTTDAFNLAPNLNPGGDDVLVRDTAMGTTVAASIMPDGLWPAGGAFSPRITNAGLEVTFTGESRPVVRDLVNGTSTIASVTADGIEQAGSSPRPSGDGRYVAFTTLSSLGTPGDTNGTYDVYLVAWREPQATAISHPTIASGTTEAITITGSGFETGASLVNFAGQLTFTNVVVQSNTQITADMTAVGPPSAQLWNILIRNPNGGPGSGSGSSGPCSCVTIT